MTCFSCHCNSDNWSSDEDVWKRHARTSPHCQHVLTTKGAHFVTGILGELGEYNDCPAEYFNQVSGRVQSYCMSDGNSLTSIKEQITHKV
mgnify:CR=1 FL=1